MTVDNGPSNPQTAQVSPQRPPSVDAAVVRFCNSFSCMRRLRHLVIRKNAYLTLPGPTHVFEQLGKAIRGWKYLVSTIVPPVRRNRASCSHLSLGLATMVYYVDLRPSKRSTTCRVPHWD